ncbi:MAG TPA: hypothetical protein VNL77_15095, partial [Roseiflexaceae bacterium]|nr:hypothetical protein [Roseiflexaceae bacterium]
MSADLTSPAHGARTRAGRLLVAARQARMAGGSALLFANALVGAGCGVIFWTLAAWRYDMAAVGLTSALASAAALVATLANLGLSAVVMRY